MKATRRNFFPALLAFFLRPRKEIDPTIYTIGDNEELGPLGFTEEVAIPPLQNIGGYIVPRLALNDVERHRYELLVANQKWLDGFIRKRNLACKYDSIAARMKANAKKAGVTLKPGVVDAVIDEYKRLDGYGA